MKCKAKCFLCSRVGPVYPCPEEDYNKFCDQCGKNFKNYDCFNYHIEKNICAKSKKCLDCGIIYRVDVRFLIIFYILIGIILFVAPTHRRPQMWY